MNFYLPNLDGSGWSQTTEVAPKQDPAEAKESADVHAALVKVAGSFSADSQRLLEGYAREALRMFLNLDSSRSFRQLIRSISHLSGLDPVVRGVYRVAKSATQVGDLNIAEGQRLYLDLASYGLDASIFRNPKRVDPNRPAILYEPLGGDSAFKILGSKFVYATAAKVLQSVFFLKNVRRAPGPTGTLRRYVILTNTLVGYGRLSFVLPTDSSKPSTRPTIKSPLSLTEDTS